LLGLPPELKSATINSEAAVGALSAAAAAGVDPASNRVRLTGKAASERMRQTMADLRSSGSTWLTSENQELSRFDRFTS
jgi:hypothetical protein